MLNMFVILCLPMQAEVQSFYADGAIALHTRSLKYGKVSKIISPKALLSTLSQCGKASKSFAKAF